MRNYVRFDVTCRQQPWKTRTLYVYYIKDSEGWLPLPPNICDYGCGLPECNDCVREVWKLSKATHPFTSEDLIRTTMNQFGID